MMREEDEAIVFGPEVAVAGGFLKVGKWRVGVRSCVV